MTDLQVSPISQLLHTLGITREDLNKRSDQMRQFLTADDAMSSRLHERDRGHKSRSSLEIQSSSRSTGSSRSLARSLSRASSSSIRDCTPPATPVKPEPREGEIPHRRMDSMEMVLERQRRQRKSRKERERESNKNVPHPPSPSPSNASHSGQSLEGSLKSRDEARPSCPSNKEGVESGALEISQPPPITPQKSKYYRDHTNLSADSQSRVDSALKTETPTPTRPSVSTLPQSLPQPQYYAYPSYVGYAHYMPMSYRSMSSTTSSSSSIPITPRTQRTKSSSCTTASSPLPPSSPPPASSPMSSPTRRVNLVSSPGPMGPAPEENEYDNLPYKLPPGPYSPNKPDLSYAALVGRAILSSPEHRLTLQEIYDWITIVYPHYKRGETTWMNSIRHVLSTTVCFRKVPRDRSVGRTLWAIYDEDLECFKDGGFKKHLCKDYVNGSDGKEKQSSSSKGKSRVRKRPDDDDTEGRKSKKPKKDQSFVAGSSKPNFEPIVTNPPFMGSNTLASHPLFPPTRPTTHHQPYYQSCLPQSQGFPAEVIFPPLPAGTAFNRVVNQNNPSTITTVTKTKDVVQEPSPPEDSSSPVHSPPSVTSSLSSIPELTPNHSSSPPSSLIATSDADIDMTDSRSTSSKGEAGSISVHDGEDGSEEASLASADDDDDNMFNTALLGPVRFWGQSPKDSGLLQPGIELTNSMGDSDDDSSLSHPDKKGKNKQQVAQHTRMIFPPIPNSPTLNRTRYALPKLDDAGRPSTPPPSFLPSTPPRSLRQDHQISSIRTPLSHKGLHMSPSASLAHYKSNLDPPPIYTGGLPPLDNPDPDDDDPMRTPRKHGAASGSSAIFGHPVTPRKLIFSSTLDDPFRTPIGHSSSSPFRTPGQRTIVDPHDPRTLLDEELSRIDFPYDSPAGLFGKGRGALLYDSPGIDSHAKWY